MRYFNAVWVVACGLEVRVRKVGVKGAVLAIGLTFAVAGPARALVYCETNAVDYHQSAPTGALADSGWNESTLIGYYMGAFIQTNALLTAAHLNFWTNTTFTFDGVLRSVTAVTNDPASDLSILFFKPGVSRVALINIETNDVSSLVVLQGRGWERGDVVVTGGLTNGWKWGTDSRIRRWGVNRYSGAIPGDETYAVATFDNNGDPDECMMSGGDSGGPGFIRTGSGWKLATVNYAVAPMEFSVSTNSVNPFYATLFDCSGLYYRDGPQWRYAPPEESPAPCMLINTRTAVRVAWITNAVKGITFPADVGLAWRCQSGHPTAGQAAQGVWFEVVATNAGPYTARDVAVDVAWPTGLCVRASAATVGSYEAGRWSLPALADGGAATLRVDAVVWRMQAGWATNRAWVSASDKPDAVASNNEALCEVWLPATATRLLIE